MSPSDQDAQNSMNKEISKNTEFSQIMKQTDQSSLPHTRLNKDSTNPQDLYQNIKLREGSPGKLDVQSWEL